MNFAEWRHRFAADVVDAGHACVMVVTSNGIARFAPYLTGDFAGFARDYNIKLATGALAILEHGATGWIVKEWNIRP